MDPKKLRFYEEICKKENQNTVIYENFTLTFTTKPLTAKFYARHDAISNDYRKENLNEITRRIALTPKDVYTFPPPTVNMQYGWFTKPLIPMTSDPRLHFPRKQCEFIKKELIIKKQYSKLTSGKSRKS